MVDIVIDGIDVSLELLESQRCGNMEVIPVRLNNNGNKDYLTLRRGMSAGFVELTECEVPNYNRYGGFKSIRIC